MNDEIRRNELEALGILYDLRRRAPLHTDYLELQKHVRKLNLPCAECAGQFKGLLGILMHNICEHLEAVKDMKKECNSTVLACSGGFNYYCGNYCVTTVCRCDMICKYVRAVLDLLRPASPDLRNTASPDLIIKHDGPTPQVVAPVKRKLTELKAIHTLFVVRPSPPDTNYLDLLSHVKATMVLSLQEHECEEDYERLKKSICDGLVYAGHHMRDNCSRYNRACYSRFSDEARECRCVDIEDEIFAIANCIRS